MLSNQNEVSKELKVIVFRLNQEEYGVEVGQVKSIERLEQVTRIPRTAKFVKGVINLRGTVIPVVDLHTRLGLEEVGSTENSRIVIVTVGEMEVGLIVDAANDVTDVPAGTVEPPPQIVGGVEAAFLRGIARLQDRLLVLLNLDRVLDPEEIRELARTAGKEG